MREKTLIEWLRTEPFTLTLSSGFFGFFAHAGTLLALEEAGVSPARCTGSSAGALVSGLWASGRSAAEVCDELSSLERREFWDPGLGLGLLRGDRMRDRLRRGVGCHSIEECRVPLAISVFDLKARRTTVLRQGDLVTAIAASCAFPMLFQPVRHGDRLYSDGGIGDRHGLCGVASGDRTLHHLLISRSPWRSRRSSGLRPVQRPEHVTLMLPELPRLGPFRLGDGPRAMNEAHRRTRAALCRPMADTFIA